jgi:hypothetical protein
MAFARLAEETARIARITALRAQLLRSAVKAR